MRFKRHLTGWHGGAIAKPQIMITTELPNPGGVHFRSVLLCGLLFVQGCGTVFTHTACADAHTPAGTGIYRGTQTDVSVVEYMEGTGVFGCTHENAWMSGCLLMFGGVLFACDLPASAVADTALWPYDRTTQPSVRWTED